MSKQVADEDKKFIVDTIQRFFPSCKIWAFGSRVSGTAEKYSDLDIAIETLAGKLKASQFLNLQTAFSESHLPYKVDLSDFASLSEDFKKQAFKEVERWG